MEHRTLEINVISANDLKDVNFVSKMDVYAVISISGDTNNTKQKAKTNVHRGSGTNPTWNFPLSFTVDESLTQNNRLTLHFKLVCNRSLGDKDLGEVNIPVNELLASMNDGNNNSTTSMKFVSYQVRKPSGKPKGELHFSYRFREKVAGKPAADKLVTAYPVVESVGPSSYPPPPPPRGHDHVHPIAGYAPPSAPYAGAGYSPVPSGYGHPSAPPQGYEYSPSSGYGYPPLTGYGYPPPSGYGYPPLTGYGYPPPQQVPQKSNKFGMGLGAGLIGGAIGGLLIGDMVSDVASYDAGFGDVGGFDF